MSKNEFNLDLIGCLQQAQSKKQINADIRQIEKSINMLRITGIVAKGDTKREINAYIKELSDKLSYVKLKGKIDEKNLQQEINKSLHNMSFDDIDALKVDENKTKLKLKKVMADLKAFAEKNTISVNVGMKKEKLNNDLTIFLNKNSKIRESSFLLEESERIRELINSVDDKGTLKNATEAFQLYKSEVSATGYATKSTTDKIKEMLSHVTKIGSLFGLVSLAVNNFKKSLSTLKGNDTILTEISKTSEMTKKQLEELGNEAFKVASKYGQLSSGYLLGVQEMARSGYEELSKALGELSLLTQAAGDMTAENANNYLLATDAAYKYGGSVEKLNAALDGANYISNRNSASLTDIADATRVSASFVSNAGVAIDELTAAEATMIATTKRSGSEIGRAFRSIVLNLQQISGEFDGEVIDEEQLKKVEARCHSLGVELEYMKDGVATLRNPMEVLKDLARVYNSLPDNSADKQGLVSDLGGKYHANSLSGLLSRWDMYEKMLSEFSQGTGSALEEAEKTANSWEGRLNALSNSFTSFVNVLTNKDAIMGGISFFDRLIQGAETLTNTIGEIPVVLTALNSALVATNKDYGITQIWNKDKGKIDLQGNLFGIDITNIKNMKKHFAEAEEAIAGWNAELVTGNADINDFGEAIVQNNAQFKEYLSTCTKDAPATLEGYKAHLKAAGVSTDALRLKTILLNSVITMLGGWAIQTLITGFYKLSQVSNAVAEKANELGNSFKSTASDIDSYKSKIEGLYKTINDSNSSISDVTEARKNLMTIQDELIDKYGTEEKVIQNVTDAINGQTEALDKLSKTKWQETKNDFTHGGFWNNVANFFQGTDNIERMLNEYGEKTILIQWADYADINKLTDEMVAELENIGIDIKVSTDNLQGIRDFDSLTESIKGTKGASLSLSGNAEEIYNKLLALQNLVGNDDSLDKLYDKAGNVADSYKELTEKYKNFYDQYILQEKIFADDSKYANTFKDITDAAEKYNEAFTSGDEGKIKEAADEYASLVSTAMATAIANGDSDVATYFENMYPILKSIVDGWNFNVAFDANTDDLQGKVQNVLDELKDENGRSLTAEEILGLGESNAQYQALVSIAHTYNMTIEEMIELLKKRNLVSNMDYQGLVGLFGQENIDNLSPEDLEIAYQIKNVGNITFEELQLEIEKIKGIADEPVTFSNYLTSSTDSLDKFQSSVKSAADAYEKLLSGNYSSTDLLDSIQTINKAASDMEESIDWETISTSGNPLQAIQDAIESVSKTYADSVLSGAGIDADSKFGQMLANIVQESYKSESALSSLNTQVDSLQSAYNNLTDIVTAYNETGYITFDQLQTLLAMEPQYLSCLVDENGQLQLNQQSMMALANQRLNDAEAQAVQQAITELGQLALQDERTAVEDNAQAFNNAVNDLAAYNEELAGTIGEASIASSVIRDLNTAISGAESQGATDVQIDTVLNNLNTKLQLIKTTRAGLSKSLGNIIGGSSSSSTKSDFSETIDFFERRVEVLNDAVNLLKANLENVNGSFAKNQLLDQSSSILEERMRNYSEAAKMYQEKAQESLSKLDSGTQKRIIDGSVNITDYIGEGNKAVVEAMNDYKGWADKVAECTEELANLKEELRQLELDKFNHIIQDFTEQFDLRDNAKNLIDKQIALFKEAGELIGESFYTAQIDQSQKQLALLENEKAELVNQMTSAIGSGRVNCCPAT